MYHYDVDSWGRQIVAAEEIRKAAPVVPLTGDGVAVLPPEGCCRLLTLPGCDVVQAQVELAGLREAFPGWYPDGALVRTYRWSKYRNDAARYDVDGLGDVPDWFVCPVHKRRGAA